VDLTQFKFITSHEAKSEIRVSKNRSTNKTNNISEVKTTRKSRYS